MIITRTQIHNCIEILMKEAGISEDKKHLMRAYCSGLFQKSSSCVEGRNAQLSLRHHGIHRLSNRSLKAQTIIHNFDARRKDRSTAAERFFLDTYDKTGENIHSIKRETFF